MRLCIGAAGLICLLMGCVPEDEVDGGEIADMGADAAADPEDGQGAAAAFGEDCTCPEAECDADADACACEAMEGSGPCEDGLICLGSPALGECTQPCEDDDGCPDGFACAGLQIGNTVTGKWCFPSE